MDTNVKLILAFALGVFLGAVGLSAIRSNQATEQLEQKIEALEQQVAEARESAESEQPVEAAAKTELAEQAEPIAGAGPSDTADTAEVEMFEPELENVAPAEGPGDFQQEDLAETSMACVLNEDVGQCVCFDQRDSSRITMSAEECQQYLD